MEPTSGFMCDDCLESLDVGVRHPLCVLGDPAESHGFIQELLVLRTFSSGRKSILRAEEPFDVQTTLSESVPDWR